MKKLDSAEPKPRRRLLEDGRQTHHTQAGSPGDLQMNPSPQKDRRSDEEAQSFWDIPFQEHLRTVDLPPAQQGNSQEELEIFWDCFESLHDFSRAAADADQQPGGQWAAESTPSVSGETSGAQRSYTSSGTEGIGEHFSILDDESEPKVQMLLEELLSDAPFPVLSPSDSLKMEVKAKGDGEDSLKDQRIELEKCDSAEPQQKPRRRSLEVESETLHPDVGYPGKLQKSPSPRKIIRPNEDPQPISLQKLPNSVGSPRAEKEYSQVELDIFWECFESLHDFSRAAADADRQPGGQWAAESTPSVSGETSGAQRSYTSSGTEGIGEHFSILDDESETKVQMLLEELLSDAPFPVLSPSDSLKMEVKAKGDGEDSLKGPVSDSKEGNLCLGRLEQSSKTPASPRGEEVMTFNAAEIEEAPGIQQSLEICAQLDPLERDSFIADKHLSDAASRVRETEDAGCGESFRQSSDLLRIQQIMKDYVCSVCGRSYCASSSLSRHKRTHTGEKPYACSECGKQFWINSRLLAHKQIHTAEKPYKCSECGESYRTGFFLSRHKRFHSKKKLYTCSECGESYICRTSLSRHKQSHTEQNLHKCSVCGKRCSSRAALLAHEHSHIFKCPECGASFSTAANYSVHKRVHESTKQ